MRASTHSVWNENPIKSTFLLYYLNSSLLLKVSRCQSWVWLAWASEMCFALAPAQASWFVKTIEARKRGCISGTPTTTQIYECLINCYIKLRLPQDHLPRLFLDSDRLTIINTQSKGQCHCIWSSEPDAKLDLEMKREKVQRSSLESRNF